MKEFLYIHGIQKNLSHQQLLELISDRAHLFKNL